MISIEVDVIVHPVLSTISNNYDENNNIIIIMNLLQLILMEGFVYCDRILFLLPVQLPAY